RTLLSALCLVGFGSVFAFAGASEFVVAAAGSGSAAGCGNFSRCAVSSLLAGCRVPARGLQNAAALLALRLGGRAGPDASLRGQWPRMDRVGMVAVGVALLCFGDVASMARFFATLDPPGTFYFGRTDAF